MVLPPWMAVALVDRVGRHRPGSIPRRQQGRPPPPSSRPTTGPGRCWPSRPATSAPPRCRRCPRSSSWRSRRRSPPWPSGGGWPARTPTRWVRRDWPSSAPNGPPTSRTLARALSRLGIVLNARGDFTESIAVLQRSVTLSRQHADHTDPGRSAGRAQLCVVHPWRHRRVAGGIDREPGDQSRAGHARRGGLGAQLRGDGRTPARQLRLRRGPLRRGDRAGRTGRRRAAAGPHA